MAIELGSASALQPKTGASRASSHGASADGESSFASALSASSAEARPAAADASRAPSREVVKKPESGKRE